MEKKQSLEYEFQGDFPDSLSGKSLRSFLWAMVMRMIRGTSSLFFQIDLETKYTQENCV